MSRRAGTVEAYFTGDLGAALLAAACLEGAGGSPGIDDLDELARRRRALPWVRVEEHYVFDTERGEQTLADLFDGRSQLLVYHFMFGPAWSEGCPLCSFWADNFNGAIVHLAHHDVTMVCASRAPYSCYGRGLDALNGAYQLFDRAPRGRDEDELPAPFMWIHRHDEYAQLASA